MMQVLFWLALGGLVYIYAGYPLLVFALSHLRPRPPRSGPIEPRVTILIAAFNEAQAIEQTLLNKLGLDYPPDRLQIVVVSDGSTDGTDAIVAKHASERVRLVRQEPRNGKSAALNAGVAHASGDILVIADANSMYRPDAVRRLVAAFADPGVGYASGRLTYSHTPGNLTGEGCSLYMRYENFIREQETRLGSIVGVNGGIDAIRASLYEPIRADHLPDLFLPLRVIQRGFRVVYEPQAVACESALDAAGDEYRMRVRVALRALWVIADMAAVLDCRRYGVYSLQVLSHKVLRYLAFAFLLVVTSTAAALWSAGPLFQAVALLPIGLAGTALFGAAAARRHRRLPLVHVAYYFLLVNCAATAAFFHFLRGDRPQLWRPRLG